MLSGKFAWFVTVLFFIFKGCSCLNATQNVTELPKTPNTTLFAISTTSSMESGESMETTATPNTFKPLNTSTTVSQNVSELIKNIFEDDRNITETEQFSVNHTIITNCANLSSCPEEMWNDTSKTNYTIVAEAVESSEGLLPYRLQNTAAIAAGVFLISAVVGYFSCVGYRRFLQRKYGNSQILVGEEVYDTSDLRYFEI